MTHPTHTPVGTRVSAATEEALQATAQAIDSSRQFASDAAVRIGDTARDLRDSASGLARTGAESVMDATDAAQRQLGKIAREAHRRVEAQPLKSVLIAAAVGAAVAGLFLAALRTRHEPE
jgi:ElaB/YqjD/DUF883 family membrane-anchored ribosome-binding protein